MTVVNQQYSSQNARTPSQTTQQKRHSRRVESQSSDREKNTSETSFTQGDVTLVNVSENVNNIFDRNLGSKLTEPSQIGNGKALIETN